MDPSAAIVHGSEGPNGSADVADPKGNKEQEELHSSSVKDLLNV